MLNDEAVTAAEECRKIEGDLNNRFSPNVQSLIAGMLFTDIYARALQYILEERGEREYGAARQDLIEHIGEVFDRCRLQLSAAEGQSGNKLH